MQHVTVTEFRQNFSTYLGRVAMGESFRITVEGRVVAGVEADKDEADLALERLKSYREASRVGDVLSPVESDWSFDRDHL